MRVMVIEPGPGFSVQDVSNGIVKGLEANGCQVGGYNFHDRLSFYTNAHVHRPDRNEWQECFDHGQALKLALQGAKAQAFEFAPHVVVIVSGFYTPPDFHRLLRARGIKTVLWLTESPYEDTVQLLQAEHADLVVINDPTNLDRFRQVQPNTHYIGHAYDPAVHRPQPHNPDRASDFFWVGTGYPSRRTFFEAVDFAGLDVKLAGNWELLESTSPLWLHLLRDQRECMENTEAVGWYSSTKVSANVYRQEHGDGDVLKPASAGWAMGPREVEMAAIGCFYLTEARGENQEVLPMVPTFDGPQDFTEKLHWWIDHPELRAEVAGKARAAIADRTFEANVARLLSLLDH